MARALIVNGDDFGLTPGVNAGILDAHTRGILTSASLFANGPATAGAIAAAARTPMLGVGCHLALVDGVPVLPATSLPTLARGGRFRPTWRTFVRDLLLRRIDRREIERELTAQIRQLLDQGVRLTHLDSHKHVHAYPPVFAIVARLARMFRIRVVRVPYESPALALVRRHLRHPRARRQTLENAALGPGSARDRRILASNELPPAPAFLGRVLTGAFTPASFRALIDSVPDGTSELMMHPGYPDAALDAVATRLRHQRADEVALLTDPDIRRRVASAGIVLAPHGSRTFVDHREV